MVFWRDILALGVAASGTAALGVLFILPMVYPPHMPLGYLTGTIATSNVTSTKYGGTHGTFEAQFDRGDVARAAARDMLVPGDRVCVRAAQRGSRIEGFMVAMEHCSAQ